MTVDAASPLKLNERVFTPYGHGRVMDVQMDGCTTKEITVRLDGVSKKYVRVTAYDAFELHGVQ